MKGIVAYQLILLAAIISIWAAFKTGALPIWIGDLELLIQCIVSVDTSRHLLKCVVDI